MQANKVVVPMDLGIETCRRAGVTDSIDHANADQRIQHAIHGCPRHPRQFPLYVVEELLGGGMVVTIKDRLQDGSALYRERKPLPSAQLLKPPQAFSRRC